MAHLATTSLTHTQAAEPAHMPLRKEAQTLLRVSEPACEPASSRGGTPPAVGELPHEVGLWGQEGQW